MTEDHRNQGRPKSIISLAGAAGLAGAAALMIPAPAFAAQVPTFNKIPIANGYDTSHPAVLSGTAQAGDTVTLYEEAYSYGSKETKTELATHPANDYDQGSGAPWPAVTTKADSSGHWQITRPLDSGHLMMVGTDDGYSNRRYAAVRVQLDLSVTATGDNSVAFTVGFNPGQPGLPVTVQRYTSSGWTTVVTGAAAGEENTQFTATAAGQPGGTPTYRAWSSHSSTNWADTDNFIVANYSANQKVTVSGTAGSTPAPAGANPVPAPTWTDPDPEPSGGGSTPTTPTTPTPTTPAVGSVKFTRIQYNAPGTDSRKNSSVNGEYFKLTNQTKKTVALKGWTVRDRAGNTFTFSGTYNLAAARSVWVRTGKGTNTTSYRYWGKTYHVWNNGGDAAWLRTGAAKTIDTCSWSKAGKGYTNC